MGKEREVSSSNVAIAEGKLEDIIYSAERDYLELKLRPIEYMELDKLTTAQEKKVKIIVLWEG